MTKKSLNTDKSCSRAPDQRGHDCARFPHIQTFELDHLEKKMIREVLDLEGQEKEVKMILNSEEKGDFEVIVEMVHRAKNTKGRITIKAVAREGQRVRMKGKVIIEKGADGTDDFLEMRGLMMDGGVVEVEPVMEILANEVKASHAASIGRIDEEQLFYLMSRGVTKDEAKTMVVEGFVKDLG